MCATGAALLTEHTAHASQQADAGTFAAEFPDASEIPGIARVDKMIEARAKRVLVVLRQIHTHAHNTPAGAMRVDQCQHELLTAIRALREHPRATLRHILNEGTCTGEEHTYLERSRRDVRYGLSVVLRRPVHDLGVSPSETLDHHLHNDTLLRNRVHGISILGHVGAAEVLALRESITLAAAEDPALKQRANLLEQQPNHPHYRKALFDDRENFLLERATQQDHNITWTVFGAAHNWTRRIRDQWNRSIDRTPLSLIELTPHAVAAWEQE